MATNGGLGAHQRHSGMSQRAEAFRSCSNTPGPCRTLCTALECCGCSPLFLPFTAVANPEEAHRAEFKFSKANETSHTCITGSDASGLRPGQGRRKRPDPFGIRPMAVDFRAVPVTGVICGEKCLGRPRSGSHVRQPSWQLRSQGDGVRRRWSHPGSGPARWGSGLGPRRRSSSACYPAY